MPKAHHSKSSTTKALEKATKDWRSAKKRERAARNALAAIVNEAVASGVMSENKVASVTAIPRMTIRKMLGKDEAAAESAAVDEPTVAATAEEPVIAAAVGLRAVTAVVEEDVVDEDVVESGAIEPAVASANQSTEPVVSADDAAQSDTDTEDASEEAPAEDAESVSPAVPNPAPPAWGGTATPSFLA